MRRTLEKIIGAVLGTVFVLLGIAIFANSIVGLLTGSVLPALLAMWGGLALWILYCLAFAAVCWAIGMAWKLTGKAVAHLRRAGMDRQ